MATRWGRRIKWISLGAIIVALGGLLLLNLVPPGTQGTRPLQSVSTVDSAQFRRDLDHLAGPAAIGGNTVEDLQNGDQFFPAMLAAIRSARQSVVLESYIYDSDRISSAFDEALIERARAGVKVHLLIDWVGSIHKSDASVERLRQAGVQVAWFHPLHWYNLNRVNDRTHRKLLVVDGRVGFIGGADIRQGWVGDGKGAKEWRDMQFRITGPVVADLVGVFEDNWLTSTGHTLLGPAYYPPLPASGTVAVQAVASAPTGHRDAIRRSVLMAIDGARRSIDLEAAYFVPDELTRDALLRALHRGVRVRILLPGQYTDTKSVLHASQAQWGTFLEAGARLYRFQPAMLHSKLMVVDGYVTLAGSANFDSRSFLLNDEANVVIYDRALAERMTAVIESDFAQSREETLSDWRGRPWWQKVEDWAASLVAGQL